MFSSHAGEKSSLQSTCKNMTGFRSLKMQCCCLPMWATPASVGWELQLFDKDTCHVLAGAIWNTLRDNECFNVVARQCFVDASHKGHLMVKAKGFEFRPALLIEYCLKFFFRTEVRHGQVEAGNPHRGQLQACQTWSVFVSVPASYCNGPWVQAIRCQSL